MGRKEILLNTHADLVKLIIKITIRSADLHGPDISAFRSLQLNLENAKKMIELMMKEDRDKRGSFRKSKKLME